MDILCSDKTGTLTQNRMSVADPVPFDGHSVEELLLFGALASKEENRDPIELPIFEALAKSGAAKRMADYRQKRLSPSTR